MHMLKAVDLGTVPMPFTWADMLLLLFHYSETGESSMLYKNIIQIVLIQHYCVSFRAD